MKHNNHSGALAAERARLWNSAIDLAKSDREQVQFPGTIMPHGVLLVLDEEN
jgi:light-regulated signal transduction histidine kinase (bacteriophytochrome)